MVERPSAVDSRNDAARNDGDQRIDTRADTAAALTRSRKLGYGVGCVAYSLPHQIIASSFLLFATAILRIPPLWAGSIIAVSAAWDAVSDPIMGAISDRTTSRRFGRRHGYLLVGGVLVAACTWLFWSIDPSLSLGLRTALLLGLVLLTKTALTVFVAPYNALGGELSTDYDERSSVQSYRAMFYLVGMIIALVGSNLIFFRSTPNFPKGQLNPAAYPAMGVSFAAIALAAALITFATTRAFIPSLPKAAPSRSPETRALLRGLGAALANRDFKALALMIFIVEAGFQISVAIGVHVSTFTYNLPGPIIGIHGLVILGFSVLSQPFWLWFSKRSDKKPALWVGMALGLACFVGAPLFHVALGVFPIDAPGLPFTLAIFFVLGGIGNGAFMSLPFSMVADTVDTEQAATGSRDDGLYYGIYTFAYKLGTSVSLVASGVVLHMVGFDAASPVQAPSTQYNLAMVPAWLLLIATPAAAYSLHRYSITRRSHAETRARLNGTADGDQQ